VYWSIPLTHWLTMYLDKKLVRMDGSPITGQINLFCWVLVLVFYLYLEGKLNAQAVQDGKASWTVAMEIQGRTFSTTRDTLYIGSTKEYLFFRSQRNRSIIVIRMEDASLLEFRPVR